MKRFKTTFAMAALFAASVFASSCSKNEYDSDNGNAISLYGLQEELSNLIDTNSKEKDNSSVISKTFNLKDFKGINVNNSVDIVFIQGKDYSIVAKGTQALVNNLKIEVNNGILNITDKKQINNTKKHGIIITVTAPSMDYVDIDGVCTFTADKLTGKNISIDVDGVSTLDIKNIVCNTIKEDLNGVVSHNGKVNAEYYELDIDGVANMETTFEGGTLDLECDGVGTVAIHVDCKKLTAKSDGVAKVKLSGTADDTTIKSDGVSEINTKNLNNF